MSGATAGNYLLLHLLRKYGTAELANECAKKLLIDSHSRSQSPYMSMQRPRQHEDETIQRIQDWLEDHACEKVSLDELADRNNLSLRQFMRRFKQATRQTPGSYLQNLRLEKAKYL